MTNKQGKNGANDRIRTSEKHIIRELENMSSFLDDMCLNVTRCRDYYRLEKGGTYDDTEVYKVGDDGYEYERPVPTVKQIKQKQNLCDRSELISNIDELVCYFKRDFEDYGQVTSCDMNVLESWLKENQNE